MKKRSPHPAAGFSLVEMLVVIAVISILTALAVPAFKGLVGVNGIRGGTDTLLSALDQTRAIALEKGTNAFLVFPANTLSRFLVVTENGTSTPNVITPRWMKLPNGVHVSASNITFATITASSLPTIDGSNAAMPLRAIRYNRFGSIHGASTNWSLSVGEGFTDGANVTFTGGANSRAVFTAEPLLGKWTPATNN
jgi:prepilin-type N-terminal cleavage/methylation domain-containing protein